jgi:hypothetical protein
MCMRSSLSRAGGRGEAERAITAFAGHTRAQDDLGFLFFYELMTNTLNVRIGPGDSPFRLGALLIRLLPEKDTMRCVPLPRACLGTRLTRQTDNRA